MQQPLRRIALGAADLLLASGLAALLLAALGLRLLARRRPRPGPRRLMVLDSAWSLRVVRARRLEPSILCRDLGGFFGHVWTVHPLAGADDSPELAVGGVTVDRLAERHTVVEGHPGRFRGLRGLPRTNFLLAQAGLWRFLDRLVRREGIGAVRVPDPYYPGLFGLALARANRIPLAIRVGGPWDSIHAATGRLAYPRIFRWRRVEKAVDRFVLPRADLVAATNRDNLAYALANGARPERSTLFPYGNLLDPVHLADPAARPSAQPLLQELGVQGRPFVVYVARLEAIKSGPDLVRAIAAAQRDLPGLTAVFVGTGSQRDALSALARELGVADRVVLAGGRDQHWIAAVLPQASAVLALSAGRALVEGALSGRPVVAYDVEWHAEFVRDGENGILVPHRDWQALARALAKLVRDPANARRLGENGRATALDEHDPARLDEHERDCYRLLLGPAPGEAMP